MIEPTDCTAREASDEVQRQRDAMAARIAAVLLERKRVGAERRRLAAEYQQVNGERVLARYYKLREGCFATPGREQHSDADFMEHIGQQMKRRDDCPISSDAAFALLENPGDDAPATANG